MLATGDELATAASKALGQKMKYEDISEWVIVCISNSVVSSFQLKLSNLYRAEAKRVLHSQSESDESELQYLIEYYSLVREGKTNYISTTAFHDITGAHPQEPDEFFNVYAAEFKLRNGNKRRKANGK